MLSTCCCGSTPGVTCALCSNVPSSLTLTVTGVSLSWFFNNPANIGTYSMSYVKPPPSWYTAYYDFPNCPPSTGQPPDGIWIGPCLPNVANTAWCLPILTCTLGSWIGYMQFGCNANTCGSSCAGSGFFVCVTGGNACPPLVTCVANCSTSYSCNPFHISVSCAGGAAWHIDQ